MAVHSGLCKSVLVFRALNRFSDRISRGSLPASGPRQWTLPEGAIHAASIFGHHVVAHMNKYGTTSVDFGRLAVIQRQHAQLNRKAMMTTALTLQEHQQSPLIVWPFRLLDLCLNSDGAVALLITSTERARDLRQSPVPIMAIMGGGSDASELWETSATRSAPELYRAADITAAERGFSRNYTTRSLECV